MGLNRTLIGTLLQLDVVTRLSIFLSPLLQPISPTLSFFFGERVCGCGCGVVVVVVVVGRGGGWRLGEGGGGWGMLKGEGSEMPYGFDIIARL